MSAIDLRCPANGPAYSQCDSKLLMRTTVGRVHTSVEAADHTKLLQDKTYRESRTMTWHPPTNPVSCSAVSYGLNLTVSTTLNLP